MPQKILQYRQLAKYYDLLYEWKDYEKESHTLLQLIRRYKLSSGNSLLDVGCGTGRHILHLRKKFDCVGMDISRHMLKEARRNVKGARFVHGDMTSFDLERQFDVALCLFSSIGYVRTYPRLARTLRNFAKHLRDGGVVIIEPWFTKAQWKQGSVHMLSRSRSDELKIVRVGYSDVRGDVSVLDERILVAEKDKGISYYKDGQTMGLFDRARFLRLMREAGLRARYTKTSLAPQRGLYIGVKLPQVPARR